MFLGPDVDQIEVTLFHFTVGGEDGELSVDASDTHGGYWAGPGDIADEEGGGGAVDGQHVGFIFSVCAEEDGVDLDIVKPSFGKKRA